MTSVQFRGHDTLTYPDHVDVSTGKTLVAVPGQSYTTAAAPGRSAGLPDVPGDGRWGTAAAPPRSTGTPLHVNLELPPLPQDAGGTATTPAAPAAAPGSED
jgi:hypothetical protein